MNSVKIHVLADEWFGVLRERERGRLDGGFEGLHRKRLGDRRRECVPLTDGECSDSTTPPTVPSTDDNVSPDKVAKSDRVSVRPFQKADRQVLRPSVNSRPWVGSDAAGFHQSCTARQERRQKRRIDSNGVTTRVRLARRTTDTETICI